MNPGDWLAALPSTAAYALSAVILAAEGVFLAGVFLPGTATVLMLGHLTTAGTIKPLCAVICAAVSAVVADSVGYAAGRRARAGRGAYARLARRERSTPAGRFKRLADLRRRLSRRVPAALRRPPGPASVLVSRWFTGPRTLIPRVVGLGTTPYARFAAWAVPAAAVWAGGLVLSGRYLGTQMSNLVSAAAHSIGL